MNKIKKWLNTIGYGDWKLEVVSADASFKNYYRLTKGEHNYILMDASLLLESIPPFIEMNNRLKNTHVKVPTIIVEDVTLGYLILEDFGNRHYFDIIDHSNYKMFYKKAIDEIIKMQKADTKGLPQYDKEFLLFEMELMQEWYLNKYLNIELNDAQQSTINKTLNSICEVVLQQPQEVFVHRDYHSRNIMFTPKDDIGIIDFQDARVGAITYDLVSLLKDCYIEWDSQEMERLALYYRDQAALEVEDTTFIKWFDFMGLQRHIKVLGIFARLHLRDGKDGYLKDIPLTLKYVIQTASKYPETKDFAMMLKSLT